jgi:hypothetical protein
MTIKAKTAIPEAWPPEDDAELVAMSKQYACEHEVRELDRELGLTEPDTGRGLLLAAEHDLRNRGISPDDATQEQMADALWRVSP